MIETIVFNDIKGTLENIDIYIHSISIERFAAIKNSPSPEHTALSNVMEAINWYYPNNTDLNEVGNIFLYMRNQSDKENTILFITFRLNATAHLETNKASVFAKTLQYLYDVITEKAESGELTDREGGKFIVPPYCYSQASFEGHF